MRRPFRLLTALSIALLSVAMVSGGAMAGVPVPPEQTTGKVGPVVIPDGETSTLVSCHYVGATEAPLSQLTVAAPEIRWPDTKPAVPGQKGKVGWRFVIQRASVSWSSWTTLRRSRVVKATATETTPAVFDEAVSLTPAEAPYTGLRVIVSAIWYRADGTVRGRVKHWVGHYWVTNGAVGTWDSPVCVEVRDFPSP